MEVCTPKAEGGLGLRSLKEWNKASMLRHLWALCKKQDTLWVKWVHSYIIKDPFLGDEGTLRLFMDCEENS